MQPTFSATASAIEVQWHLTCNRFAEWTREDIFHFRWFFLLALFIISGYIWWKMLDKSRLNEIFLYTAFITIITLVLDELGEELSLWDYPVDIFPIFPPLTAVDLASLPIIYSLIYQYFGTWKKFITATVIMAVIFCFVLEPILVWVKIYQTITWKYYYGFPIYSLMAIFTRAVVLKVYKTVGKNKILGRRQTNQ